MYKKIVTILAIVLPVAGCSSAPTSAPSAETTPVVSASEETIVTPMPGDAWQQVGEVRTARSEGAASEIDSLLYTLGGFNGEGSLDAFDLDTGTWTALANLPGPRHHLMAAGYGGKLYVFGGASPEESMTDTAWVYDPATDTWGDLAPMPEDRYAGAAVVVDDFIYVVGGVGPSGFLLRYDPVKDEWTKLAHILRLREHLAAVALDGKIYALGGRWDLQAFNTIEIYDPASDSWSTGKPMQEARSGFGAVVVDNRIIVMGGEVFSGGARALDSVEVLDPVTSDWVFGPLIPKKVHGIQVTTFDGTIYILGGSAVPGGIGNIREIYAWAP
jgi:N-acetylneuraminic acid mutarotase